MSSKGLLKLTKLDIDGQVGTDGSALPVLENRRNFPLTTFEIERLIAMFRMVIDNNRLSNANAISNFHHVKKMVGLETAIF